MVSLTPTCSTCTIWYLTKTNPQNYLEGYVAHEVVASSLFCLDLQTRC